MKTIGKMKFYDKDYQEIIKEAQQEIKDFNEQFLINWSE